MNAVIIIRYDLNIGYNRDIQFYTPPGECVKFFSYGFGGMLARKAHLEQMKTAEKEKVRKAAVVSCRLAFKETDTKIPISDGLFEHLSCGNFLVVEQIYELNCLADNLYNQYFELENQSNSIVMKLFSSALAISVLSQIARENSLF